MRPAIEGKVIVGVSMKELQDMPQAQREAILAGFAKVIGATSTANSNDEVKQEGSKDEQDA